MRRIGLIVALAVIIVAGCKSDKKNAVLDEAFEVHKSIREVQKEVIVQWKSLEELKTEMSDSLINQNKELYASWKHDLLEVPGYPHIHLEGDAHEHNHHEQTKLPDNQILEIQKEAKKMIDEIYAKNQKLLDSLSQQ